VICGAVSVREASASAAAEPAAGCVWGGAGVDLGRDLDLARQAWHARGWSLRPTSASVDFAFQILSSIAAVASSMSYHFEVQDPDLPGWK